ncbi:hypothetical protein pneo_cds_7 [Pandoravirus neocaledonia]|uniref:Uncharacterized protein n=1 Tax=Pandoravirus neocaledonia TaxID=2107708 RepID=A0A2U7UAZ9_9VIRU|nr:hypothetical protein pneo_cds_7 [Pandoravirus neocaledonia]AVK75614.1 hypothetical protein pneo_cds_7 [Pandoravirus neocaledonia]
MTATATKTVDGRARRADVDLSRFPTRGTPYREYHGLPDPYAFVDVVVFVIAAVVAVAYACSISIIAFCAALALVASIVAAVCAYKRRVCERLERHCAAMRVAIKKRAPGAYLYANIAQLTSDSCRRHTFFVMIDLKSPTSERGAVVYDIHQLQHAWPLLLANPNWTRLFHRTKAPKSHDGVHIDHTHTIYTAKRDVDDFALFLSASARADLHMQRLVAH